jgi:bacterioferritin
MSKENMTTESNITREQMIQLLNEDLAGEYQAIIAYTVYSQVLKGAAYTDIARELEVHAGEELAHAIKIARQIDYLGGMPCVTPKPVKTSNDPIVMLRADLENERTTVGRYRERIRQAEAMGEFALSETLRAIIVQEQEHEISLAAALDIEVPPAIKPVEGKMAKTACRTASPRGMRPLYETLIRERSYSPHAKNQSSDESAHRAFARGCWKSHGAEGPGAVRDLGGSAHRPGQSLRRLRE